MSMYGGRVSVSSKREPRQGQSTVLWWYYPCSSAAIVRTSRNSEDQSFPTTSAPSHHLLDPIPVLVTVLATQSRFDDRPSPLLTRWPASSTTLQQLYATSPTTLHDNVQVLYERTEYSVSCSCTSYSGGGFAFTVPKPLILNWAALSCVLSSPSRQMYTATARWPEVQKQIHCQRLLPLSLSTPMSLSSSVIEALQITFLATFIATLTTFPIHNISLFEDAFIVCSRVLWSSTSSFPCAKAYNIPLDSTVSSSIGSSGKRTLLTEKIVGQLHYSESSKREDTAAWKTLSFVFGRFRFFVKEASVVDQRISCLAPCLSSRAKACAHTLWSGFFPSWLAMGSVLSFWKYSCFCAETLRVAGAFSFFLASKRSQSLSCFCCPSFLLSFCRLRQ